MTFICPKDPNHIYLLVWSGSARFGFDPLSDFSLGLLNSPIFPKWFGKLDAQGRATGIGIELPRASGFKSFTAYTHGLLFSPDATRFVSLSSNALRQTVRP